MARIKNLDAADTELGMLERHTSHRKHVNFLLNIINTNRSLEHYSIIGAAMDYG